MIQLLTEILGVFKALLTDIRNVQARMDVSEQRIDSMEDKMNEFQLLLQQIEANQAAQKVKTDEAFANAQTAREEAMASLAQDSIQDTSIESVRQIAQSSMDADTAQDDKMNALSARMDGLDGNLLSLARAMANNSTPTPLPEPTPE